METEFEIAASSLKQAGCAKKTRRLAGAIVLGLFSGFLLGPPGCISPKHFPRPPGLSLSSATEINRQSALQAQAFAPAQSLETISEKNN